MRGSNSAALGLHRDNDIVNCHPRSVMQIVKHSARDWTQLSRSPECKVSSTVPILWLGKWMYWEENCFFLRRPRTDLGKWHRYPFSKYPGRTPTHAISQKRHESVLFACPHSVQRLHPQPLNTFQAFAVFSFSIPVKEILECLFYT